MSKTTFDPGFTQRYGGTMRRAINKDGNFNVRRRGIRLADRSLYQHLVSIRWPAFHLIIVSAYLGVNAIFACLYLLAGTEHIGIPASTPAGEAFLSAFFFSVQTFTTVGYGTLAPHGILTNSITVVESLAGLMSFGLSAGLLYGRFSKPTVRINFTERAIIAPYQDKRSLQFRIVNRRENDLLELEAKVLLMTVDRSGNQPIRRYAQLAPERSSVYFFPLPWTIVHPIDEASPLHGKTPEALERMEAELLILIKAYDETYRQTVYARFSYRYDEIVWGARFIPAFQVDDAGDVTLHVDHINKMERVDLPA